VHAKPTKQATKQIEMQWKKILQLLPELEENVKTKFCEFLNFLIICCFCHQHSHSDSFPFGFLVYWEKNFVPCIVVKHPFMELTRKSRINFPTS